MSDDRIEKIKTLPDGIEKRNYIRMVMDEVYSYRSTAHIARLNWCRGTASWCNHFANILERRLMDAVE